MWAGPEAGAGSCKLSLMGGISPCGRSFRGGASPGGRGPSERASLCGRDLIRCQSLWAEPTRISPMWAAQPCGWVEPEGGAMSYRRSLMEGISPCGWSLRVKPGLVGGALRGGVSPGGRGLSGYVSLCGRALIGGISPCGWSLGKDSAPLWAESTLVGGVLVGGALGEEPILKGQGLRGGVFAGTTSTEVAESWMWAGPAPCRDFRFRWWAGRGAGLTMRMGWCRRSASCTGRSGSAGTAPLRASRVSSAEGLGGLSSCGSAWRQARQ